MRPPIRSREGHHREVPTTFTQSDSGGGPDVRDYSPVDALVAKQEIYEVLARFLRAADRGDVEDARRCYLPGATEDHGGVFTGTADDYIDHIAGAITHPRSLTTHAMTNVLVELDGGHSTRRVLRACLRANQALGRHSRHTHLGAPDRPLRLRGRQVGNPPPRTAVGLEPRHGHSRRLDLRDASRLKTSFEEEQEISRRPHLHTADTGALMTRFRGTPIEGADCPSSPAPIEGSAWPSSQQAKSMGAAKIYAGVRNPDEAPAELRSTGAHIVELDVTDPGLVDAAARACGGHPQWSVKQCRTVSPGNRLIEADDQAAARAEMEVNYFRASGR